jgi:glyceraldehyde 3-phosphate dehydrogenase
MRKLKIGLNGFGRIGRAFTRIALSKNIGEIVAINTGKSTPELLAYLLKYDSVYRKFDREISFGENFIKVDNHKITTYNIKEPENIPWKDHDIDIIIDCTGKFTNREGLTKHIGGSVKQVLLTAPAKDDSIKTIVLGVNDDNFDFRTDIISNASCTTNCAAPMFKIINDNLKIISGFLSTVHAYTSTQELLDNASKEFERSRAAALNIVPSTTGAAKTVVKVISGLSGKIDGMAMRVPVPTGSFTDISCVVEKNTSVEEINSLFKRYSVNDEMKNILGYETDVLVSSDYIGNPKSCTFDPNYTKVINGNFVKIFGWYDNEWGYSNRLVDLIEKISREY